MKLFLTGGFLGSGKTTAIAGACSVLIEKGMMVGVVTNDQGTELVDTAYLKSLDIDTREVPGSCFCCNYNALSASIESLVSQVKPDVIFAESVGSCADLVATIARPMASIEPGIDVIVSVFADASLLLSLLNGSAAFLSDALRYIYKKQLEEADLIVLNKIDLVSEEDLGIVSEMLQQEYPAKIILYQDSLQQADIGRWVDTLLAFDTHQTKQVLEIDYDLYAAGEAQMAWLDEVLLFETQDFSAVHHAVDLVNDIITEIRKREYFVGHLKFMLDDGLSQTKISFTAGTATEPFRPAPASRSNTVLLLINARVHTEPETLTLLIEDAMAGSEGCAISVKKFTAFKPGYPGPTHRIAG